MTDLDMVNRDPNRINSHVQVNFEDTIAEPDGAHSIDCVWRNSYNCFSCGRNFIYKLCTIICGVPAALLWGCEFGCIAVTHVWCCTPCMRYWVLNIVVCQKLYGSCIQCCLGPIAEAYGLCFKNVKNI